VSAALDIACPECGEQEELRGSRQGQTILITCESCGVTWERDLTPRCKQCGGDDVRVAFQAIMEKARGTQLSIASLKQIWLCLVCDAEKYEKVRETNRALPPDELPTT